MFEAPEPVDLTRLLSGYEVLELIACGGMGAVYRAQQVSLQRDVAIKVLPREYSGVEEFAASFKAEARAMARLSHVNLVGVYDFGEVEGMLYLVMEFINGESLHDIANGQVVDPIQAMEIVQAAAAGLGHAHRHDILHRDIKPANILLTQNLRPKLGDFGLAVSVDDVGAGLNMGTPGYAAPELFEDYESATPCSDTYSLGMILHELLTGVTPTGEAPANIELVPNLRGLRQIVHGATAQKPLLRFKDGDAMEKALGAWLHEAQKLPPHVFTGANSPSTLSAPRMRQPLAAEPAATAGSTGGSGAVLTLAAGAIAVVGIALFFVFKSVGGKDDGAENKPDPPQKFVDYDSAESDDEPPETTPDEEKFDLEAHRKEMRAALSQAKEKLFDARLANIEALRDKARNNGPWGRYFALVDGARNELPRDLSGEVGITISAEMAGLLNEFAGKNQAALDKAHLKAIDAIHDQSVRVLKREKALPSGDASHNASAWMEWLGVDPGQTLGWDVAGTWELWTGPQDERDLILTIRPDRTIVFKHEELEGTGRLARADDGSLKVSREGSGRFWELRWRAPGLAGVNEQGAPVRFRRKTSRFFATVDTPEAGVPPIAGNEPGADDGGPGIPEPEPEPEEVPLEDKQLANLRAEYRLGVKTALEKWFTSYQTRLEKAAGGGSAVAQKQIANELARVKALDWKRGYLTLPELRSDNPVPRNVSVLKQKLEDHLVETMAKLQPAYLKKLKSLRLAHDRRNDDTTEVEAEMEPFVRARRIDLTNYYNARPQEGAWHGGGSGSLGPVADQYRSKKGITYDIRGILQLNSGRYTSGQSQRVGGKDLAEYTGKDYRLEYKDIPVNQKADAIFVVGATIYGRAREGTTVASVIIHYEDDSKRRFKLQEKVNLADWYRPKDLPEASLVWQSENHGVYEIEFKNPHPEKTIVTIDLESEKEASGPFILAITLD